MTTLADINHDSGGAVNTHWDNNSARASITVGAALNGSVEGLQVGYSTSGGLVFKTVTPSTTELELTFYFDPNGAGTPTASPRVLLSCGIFELGSGTDLGTFLVTKKTTGVIEVDMTKSDDSGSGSIGSPFTITDDVHLFKIAAKRASSAIAGDGYIKFYVDDVLKVEGVTQDNYDFFILVDGVKSNWNGLEAAMSGTTIYLDEVLLIDAVTPTAFSGYDLVIGGGQP